jgi:DNA-directed RNA polymerase delta subunit
MAELYNSLLVDSTFIMVGDNTWNLTDKYTYEEIERINKINLGIDKKGK